MVNLYVMVGLPGSGKSTFAAAHPEMPVVCLDTIRGELYGDENIQGNGYDVACIAFERIHRLLNEGHDVIYDACNVRPKYRKQLLEEFNFCNVIAVYVDTPKEICYERNAARSRVVPKEVIDRMAAALVEPSVDEGFAKIITLSEGQEDALN